MTNEQTAHTEEQVAAIAPTHHRLRVGITHGDINGVGYELIFRTFAAPETACHRKGDPEVEHFFADPEQCHDGDGLFSKEHNGDQGPHRAQIGECPAAVKTAGTRRIQMQGPGDTQGKEAAPDPGGDAQKGKGQQTGIR